MHHYRKTILDELRPRITGLPGQVGAPLNSPDDVTDQSQVPAACVFFTEEPVRDRRGASGEGCKFTRDLSTSIVLIAKRPDDLELLAAEVEKNMLAEIAPGVQTVYDGTVFQQPKRGEFEFFALAINYKISYSTDEGSPDRLSS